MLHQRQKIKCHTKYNLFICSFLISKTFVCFNPFFVYRLLERCLVSMPNQYAASTMRFILFAHSEFHWVKRGSLCFESENYTLSGEWLISSNERKEKCEQFSIVQKKLIRKWHRYIYPIFMWCSQLVVTNNYILIIAKICSPFVFKSQCFKLNETQVHQHHIERVYGRYSYFPSKMRTSKPLKSLNTVPIRNQLHHVQLEFGRNCECWVNENAFEMF